MPQQMSSPWAADSQASLKQGVAVRGWYFSVQPGGVPGNAQLLLLPSVTW